MSKKLVHWSEQWRPVEDWLKDFQNELAQLHNKVKKGSDYDRWDIQSRSGLFALVRTLVTIEEHGMGKQYLKFKLRLLVSMFGLAVFLLLVLLTYLAFLSQAIISAAFLGASALLLGLKIIADSCGALAAVRKAINELPDGVTEIESETSTQKKEKIEFQPTLSDK